MAICISDEGMDVLKLKELMPQSLNSCHDIVTIGKKLI